MRSFSRVQGRCTPRQQLWMQVTYPSDPFSEPQQPIRQRQRGPGQALPSKNRRQEVCGFHPWIPYCQHPTSTSFLPPSASNNALFTEGQFKFNHKADVINTHRFNEIGKSNKGSLPTPRTHLQRCPLSLASGTSTPKGSNSSPAFFPRYHVLGTSNASFDHVVQHGETSQRTVQRTSGLLRAAENTFQHPIKDKQRKTESCNYNVP